MGMSWQFEKRSDWNGGGYGITHFVTGYYIKIGDETIDRWGIEPAIKKYEEEHGEPFTKGCIEVAYKNGEWTTVITKIPTE